MRRNSLIAALFVSVLLISLVSLQAKAQVPLTGNTITGFVFDPQRRPISQVYVELINDVNSVLQRMRTDGSGQFVFRGVSQGRFQLRVLAVGTIYEDQTQEVDTSGRPSRDTIQKDFYLHLRKSGPVSAPGTIFVQEIPEEAKTIYQRAVADLDRSRLEDGVAGLESALKIFPDYYLALERLGLIYLTQQEYEKAVGIFGKAVVVNPRSFNGWYGLSCSHYALKNRTRRLKPHRKRLPSTQIRWTRY